MPWIKHSASVWCASEKGKLMEKDRSDFKLGLPLTPLKCSGTMACLEKTTADVIRNP